MKLYTLSTLFVGATLLFSAGTFAKNANKASLQLTDDVIVEGKALSPGRYTVEWTGTGSDVQVTLKQGKDTVATFPAHVTSESTSNPDNAYGTTTEPDGTRALSVIYPGGKNLELNIAPSGTNSPNSTPSH